MRPLGHKASAALKFAENEFDTGHYEGVNNSQLLPAGHPKGVPATSLLEPPREQVGSQKVIVCFRRFSYSAA